MENFLDHSIEAEQGLLAGLIRLSDYNSDPFQKAIAMLKDSSFYSLQHKIIFSAIKAVGVKSKVVDLITVSDFIEKQGNSSEGCDFLYLSQMMKANPSAANVTGYAKIIREYAVERFSVRKLNEIMANFTDRSNGDIYQRLGSIESMVSEISNMGLKADSGGLKHITDSLSTWLDNIEQVQNDGYDRNAFTTGVESLDDILGVKGMRRGSLVGVGARPKMGKSAFMMLLANHFALDLKEPVAVFSMEMPSHEIAERAITTRTNMAPSVFYRGNNNEAKGRLDTSFDELVRSNLMIDDGSGLSLSHIIRESRKMYRDKGKIGLICVDYLTLMEAEKAERNDLAYGKITKALKNLAKELNCVVLLLTQLNRGLENRPDKRPMPSDSRDTGQIEQDVDLWIGLYKASVYHEEICEQGLTEVITRLNRHGGTGTAFVNMHEGFHVPLSTNDGAKLKHNQDDFLKPKEEEGTTFRAKSNKNKQAK